MKNKLFGIITAIIALTLTACPEPDPHTHTYAAAWSTSPTQHWRECTANDGAKTDIAAHTAGDWIIDTPATATTVGSRHKECTVCGYEIETETIPATGVPHTHDYGTAWKSNATEHWRECSCGDKTDVANHDWEWVETTPATTQAEGLETETCKTCKATSGNTRIIEKTVKTFSVSFDFQNPTDPNFRYDATITDARTSAGSANLEQLGIKQQIVEAIEGAFDGGNGPTKGRFRNVFGDPAGSVSIIVENSMYYEGPATPSRFVMKFHINYLTGNPADIQEQIRTAITAMNGMTA